jgi:anaerobic selenocysteine-containing dehydrogenase
MMAKVVKTICQMCGDAYATCGLDVHVENGKVVKVKGNKNNPTNRGTLCPKGVASIQLQYDPRRLRHPLKRIGERGEGRWERISWEEALDTIAGKLNEFKQKYGPESLYFHRGQGSGWESPKEFVHRFMLAFGSPNYGSHSFLCDAPRAIGHVFTYGANKPLPDWNNTKCMLLWGYNPMETSLPNHGARIIWAKERGAKLIVIDPRFTRTVAKADIWVQPRPGTDCALALAMANVIINEGLQDTKFIERWTTGYDKFTEHVKQYSPEKAAEITWVPADTIREVARTYATVKPATLWECNGLDQHTNVVQTSRALAILRVITGNLDVKGGNVWDPEGFGLRKTRDMSSRPEDWKSIEDLFSRSVAKYIFQFKIHGCRTVDAIRSLETGEPYRIKAMIVEGGDPLISLPNYKRLREALMKLELLVVHDIFMTNSAEIADIVLPAATFFERTNLVKYMFEGKPRVDTNFLALMDKAVEPLDECKSDVDLLCELGRKMGLDEYFPWQDIEGCINYELEPVGLTVNDLRKAGGIISRKYDPEKLYGKYDSFCANLPSKKIELYSKVFEQRGQDPLPAYREPTESPFSRPDLAENFPLICQATIKPGLFTHGMFRTLPWLNEVEPEPWVEMSPEKTEELGINDGDNVVVESPRGSIKVKARITAGIDPRVVSITHGWGQAYATGAMSNMITPDPEDGECPISGATGNRAFLCRISKA